MIDLKEMQRRAWENKLKKGFNTREIHTIDVYREFCYLYGEVAEAFDAYRKKKSDFKEELADIAIFLLGISEMLDVNLEEEIGKKIEKNERREYKLVDGVWIRTKDGEK